MKIVSLGPQYLQTEDPVTPQAPPVPGAQVASGAAPGPAGQQSGGSLGHEPQRVISLIEEIRRRRMRRKQLHGSEVSRRYKNLDDFDDRQLQTAVLINTRA